MAERYMICKGDKTTHGGTVLEGSEMFMVEDAPVAHVGHRVSCPQCDGIFPIVEGTNQVDIMGMKVALEGMKTACGAILISSQTQASVDDPSWHGNKMSVMSHPKSFISDTPRAYCDVNAIKDFNYPKFSAWDLLKWKMPLIGDKKYLTDFKEGFIIFHKEYIKKVATRYNIPNELLAGVIYNEVGGMPDFIKKDIVLKVRQFDHGGPDFIDEYLTISKPPQYTSIGAVAMQVRVAAKALGEDPTKLTEMEIDQIADCLYQDHFNIDLVGQHLKELILYDFPEIDTRHLNDSQFIISGSRYNRGIERQLSDYYDSLNAPVENVKLRDYTSYGRAIFKRKTHIKALLQ